MGVCTVEHCFRKSFIKDRRYKYIYIHIYIYIYIVCIQECILVLTNVVVFGYAV